MTSTLTVPRCVDRLEVGGEHERVGKRLVFDHSFDPPFSRTEVTLKRGESTETISIWNNQPEGGRLLIGSIAAIFGGVLWSSAAYEVGVNGARFNDEGPFYAAVFGTGALGVGTLLMLTGWHPRVPPAIDGFCREAAGSSEQ